MSLSENMVNMVPQTPICINIFLTISLAISAVYPRQTHIMHISYQLGYIHDILLYPYNPAGPISTCPLPPSRLRQRRIAFAADPPRASRKNPPVLHGFPQNDLQMLEFAYVGLLEVFANPQMIKRKCMNMVHVQLSYYIVRAYFSIFLRIAINMWGHVLP
jgi:hypothetical protein